MARAPHSIPALAALAALGLLAGCFRLLDSEGGGQVPFTAPRAIDPEDIALPAGYRIEPVAAGFTFPTAVTFDDQRRLYVLEAGYAYGGELAAPQLLRLEPDGTRTVIATGEQPPWNGVAFHEGAFYIAAGGVPGDGRILRVTMDGRIDTLVRDLPSGDHHTNGPVIGPDGWLYFAQGTVTNSGVVGIDNYDFGWLPEAPKLHDVPCRDIVLRGIDYPTANPLTPEPDDRAITGAFVPFGVPTEEGQVIPGRVPCSGAVLRVAPAGGPVELVAWGFRNPFGLAFDPAGRLYLTENGYDVRGSRPVFGAADHLWAVQPGLWYGWPEFSGTWPVIDPRFRPPDESGALEDAPQPLFVLAEHPNVPPEPIAYLGVHSSSNGLDFGRTPRFGPVGAAYIAQFGDMAPTVGKVLGPVGFKVVRVDPTTGVVTDFAVNEGRVNGPASWLNTGGLERPVSVRFSPDGESLYVVDFGVMTIRERADPPGLTTATEHEAFPHKGTGVLWRITRESAP